jgi:hypothetical protein
LRNLRPNWAGQLEAEFEKVGPAAIQELMEESPADYLAVAVFLASRDPGWARLLKKTLQEHIREHGLPKLPH